MSIFNRLSNIVKSNINSAMNKVEDPGKILDQNILEMEKQYMLAKKGVASAKGEEIKLDKRVDILTKEVEKWVENSKLALFSKNDEDLAKRALARKSEVEKELKIIKEDRDSMSMYTGKLVNDLRDMEKRISDAKRKKELLKSRIETAKAKKMMVDTQNSINGIGASSFDSFNRMEEKANKIINDVDAMEELNESLNGGALEKEFDNLNSDSNLDFEFEKLKKGLR